MKSRKKRFVGPALLIAALVFLFIGVQNGEMKTVLKKATTICMECIGIG